MKDMILKPRVSEKAYGLSQVGNVYVFDVPASANKQTVAQAVAAQFEVTVVTVNMTNIQGKAKRTYHKRRGFIKGRDTDTRKAYVRVKQGDHIPVFAAEEAEEAEKAKAAEKAAKKEKK